MSYLSTVIIKWTWRDVKESVPYLSYRTDPHILKNVLCYFLTTSFFLRLTRRRLRCFCYPIYTLINIIVYVYQYIYITVIGVTDIYKSEFGSTFIKDIFYKDRLVLLYILFHLTSISILRYSNY